MPRKAALGLTLTLFLINANQANQRWFPCPECWFPLRRNHGFLIQEYPIDERIQRIKERRTVGRASAPDRGDTRRTGTERPAYRGTEDAAQRISDLEREIKQRERKW